MRVILLEDVKALGTQGQIVEVPDGYAENFLFPQHVATPAPKEEVEEKRGRGRPKVGGGPDPDQAVVAADGAEIVVEVAADKHGHLKAPVTAKDIRKALKDEGYAVEPEWIKLGREITEPGEEEVKLVSPTGFESFIRVLVEAT